MQRQIVINSHSSGNYREETINGRPHIVTEMVSIAVNSVMNRIFYPEYVVRESYAQLDRVPAPASHPKVDGAFISASDPVAINAHNVGAFALNPRLQDGRVINDLAIDIEVAERDPRGVEIMRRVRNSEQMGVSTGLNGELVMVNGEFAGREYEAIINNIAFDHVAVLLDEAPAGETTYTLNSEQDDGGPLVCNFSINELRDKLQGALDERYRTATLQDGRPSHVWIVDVLLDPNSVIAEVNEGLQQIPFDYNANGDPVLTGVGTAVQRVVTFEPNAKAAPAVNSNEGQKMDLEKIVLCIIANAGNTLGVGDKDRLMSMDEAQLMAEVHNNLAPVAPTVEQARELCTNSGLVVNESAELDGFDEFQTNAAEFNAWKAEQAEQRKAKADELVANSEFTDEDVAAMSVEQIDRALASLGHVNDFSAQGGGAPARNPAGGVKVDYS